MDLSDLNIEQAAAVKHTYGPQLVVAGAGTGKTTVITRRIAYLLEQNLAKPQEILALTFTEKAAGELLDRLDVLLGWQAYQVNAMTFHAFGSQLISRFAHRLGMSSHSQVLTETSKLVLLKDNIDSLKLGYYGRQQDMLDFVRSKLELISELQNQDITPVIYRQIIEAKKIEGTLHEQVILELEDNALIYDLYESVKRKYNVIDYYDQIQIPLLLLQQNPHIVEKLGYEYQFFMVDEYQDTNKSQDSLLRLLVPKGGNIFAVGDDDQAIYGFRGAELSNIMDFASHFDVKDPIVLTQNYRSTGEILDLSYRFITHNNPERLESRLGLNKKLISQTSGSAPQFHALTTIQQEYEFIAESIQQSILHESGKNNTIAVLAPAHSNLRGLAKVFKSRGISYQLVSSISIFEHTEMIQLWYLLQWLIFQANDNAITSILMGPYFAWPSADISKLGEISSSELLHYEQAIEVWAKQGNELCQATLEKLNLWRELAKNVSVSQLVYQMIFDSGYAANWVAKVEEKPALARIFEDLEQLLQHMREYELVAIDPSLSSYLRTFIEQPEVLNQIAVGHAGVQLLTIHAAKGLEFDTVYVVNNTQSSWSLKSYTNPITDGILNSDDQKEDSNREFRRVLYVAATRAKQNLYFSASTQQSGGRNKKISQYMYEMFDKDYINLKQVVGSKNNLDNTMTRIQQYSSLSPNNSSSRLPFEDKDGWLILNPSQISSYDNCPYHFYIDHILKINQIPGPNMRFGTLLHSVFDTYNSVKLREENIELDTLLEIFKFSWEDRGYDSKHQAELALDTGLQTIKSFYYREESEKRKVRSSEESFVLRIPEAKLIIRGRIDATFWHEEEVEVRDYKSSRQHNGEKADKKAFESLQLRTYALAIEAMLGRPPFTATLDYVVTGIEGKATYSNRVLTNHRAKLAAIADEIRAGLFEPNKSLLHACSAVKYWGKTESEEE